MAISHKKTTTTHAPFETLRPNTVTQSHLVLGLLPEEQASIILEEQASIILLAIRAAPQFAAITVYPLSWPGGPAPCPLVRSAGAETTVRLQRISIGHPFPSGLGRGSTSSSASITSVDISHAF